MKKAGKLIRLVHNPTAGMGEYSKQKITSLIEKSGYRCSYSSSKRKILKDIEPETEFIAIAGGDGTIRKVIVKLLDKKLKYKRPIALLPFGTANNIAMSLNIHEDTAKNISSWSEYNLKKFDVGQVIGLEKTSYFIESFGLGLFPKLMSVLKETDTTHVKKPEDEFKLALEKLLKITKYYKAFHFKIEIDDRIIEDECILIEVMNISSLGPHLKLGKDADPGDGFFDVVIVTDKDRNLMEEYIYGKIDQRKPEFKIKSIRAKQLKVTASCSNLHVDDEVLKVKTETNLNISLLDSLIEIVTGKSAD
ncbi:MAG: diacylglycerol kinase [Pedobacter sp.]|nr:MAG: diacylglycerol kinase [Pedobacter sp.]